MQRQQLSRKLSCMVVVIYHMMKRVRREQRLSKYSRRRQAFFGLALGVRNNAFSVIWLVVLNQICLPFFLWS